MASETTPLVPKTDTNPSPDSAAGGTSPAYFLGARHSRDPSPTDSGVDDLPGTPIGREVNLRPAGTSAAEFSSRPVVGRSAAPPEMQHRRMNSDSVGGGWLDYVPDAWKGGHTRHGPISKEKESESIGASKIGTLMRLRKVPVKVEPKVHMANERTFLVWLHLVLVMAAASLVMETYSTGDNLAARLYGIVLLPVSVAFTFYALWQYLRRSTMITHRLPGPYIDVAGPVTLTVILIATIIAQFCLKLNEVVNE